MQLEQKDLDAIAAAVAAKVTIPAPIPAADIAKAVWAATAPSFSDKVVHSMQWYQQANDQNLHTIILTLNKEDATAVPSDKITQIVQDAVTAALKSAGIIK